MHYCVQLHVCYLFLSVDCTLQILIPLLLQTQSESLYNEIIALTLPKKISIVSYENMTSQNHIFPVASSLSFIVFVLF